MERQLERSDDDLFDVGTGVTIRCFRQLLQIKHLGIAVSLNGANEALIDIDGAASGTYELVCTLHEFGGMVGTLTVTR